MFHRCSLVCAVVVALALYDAPAPVHANTVLLNNLDQSITGSTENTFVGQSFIAGTVTEPLFGARMQLDSSAPPDAQIGLEVEARNFDGTVGATLFSNFTSSFNSATNVVTFTANSSFQLTAGTGYWLVLSDRTAGRVTWDYTSSLVYQSEFGYGLPSTNTAWSSNADNGQGQSTYYQPSDGPQLFQLIAFSPAAVPEPSSIILLSCPVAIALVTRWVQNSRRGRTARAI